MKKAPKFPEGYVPLYREVAGTDFAGKCRAPSMSDLRKPKPKKKVNGRTEC